MNKTITALAIMMASFAANASVLPETPVPFKSGTGAIDNDTVYIGLGSAGTAWYKLDTQAKDKKWTALAAFPGGPRDQATSAFIDGNLYVFGGIGKNSKGLTQVFNDVHKYNPKTNSWVKLMSHAPMGMAGHVTFVHNGKAYVTGGVNQNIFNGYFEDLNEAGKDSVMSSSRPVFRSRWLPYLLVAPQLIITVIFFIWPAGEALWYSLQSVDPFGFSSQFVGLDNFPHWL